MKSNRLNRCCISLAAVAAISLTTAAFGQYVWLNENGIKHYSDTPPPPSVPKNRILKQPGKASSPMPQAIFTPAEAVANVEKNVPAFATKEKAPMTTAEKKTDFDKRRIEQAEKEKKAAEQEKLAADKSKNCEQARAFQRTLDSGQRLARSDKNGERYYVSDAERAKEAQEARRVLDDCK
jgi:hypothetical protein